jgi:hypothetical protein
MAMSYIPDIKVNRIKDNRLVFMGCSGVFENSARHYAIMQMILQHKSIVYSKRGEDDPEPVYKNYYDDVAKLLGKDLIYLGSKNDISIIMFNINK